MICCACGCQVYRPELISDILSVAVNNNNDYDSSHRGVNTKSTVNSKDVSRNWTEGENGRVTETKYHPCRTKTVATSKYASKACIQSYRSTFSLQFPVRTESSSPASGGGEEGRHDASPVPSHDDHLTEKNVARGKSLRTSTSATTSDAAAFQSPATHPTPSSSVTTSSSARIRQKKKKKKGMEETTTTSTSFVRDYDENLCIYQDIDFSTVSDNLKALLSPQRDWIKCSMCRSEVSWLARAKRLGIQVIITSFHHIFCPIFQQLSLSLSLFYPIFSYASRDLLHLFLILSFSLCILCIPLVSFIS